MESPKWKPLHQADDYNISGRNKKKILAKTSWFKRKREDEEDGEGRQPKSSRQEHLPRGPGNQRDVSTSSKEHETGPEGWKRDEPEEVRRARTTGGTHHHKSQEVKEGKIQPDGRGKFKPKKKAPMKKNKTPPPTISVLFVDQTKGGILAKRLQEAEDRLAILTGYRIRVTESCGTQLSRILPNTNPWNGEDCTRPECYSCRQGDEKLQNCKQRNILYESYCTICNPEGLKEGYRASGVYVGESARSLYERAKEHHDDELNMKEDSHRMKHWVLDHPNLPDPPKFKMKIVSSYRDPLTRQVGEAVRIEMRGGNTLNSKTEYNRCRLPRLTIDQEVWQVMKRKEKEILDEETRKLEEIQPSE